MLTQFNLAVFTPSKLLENLVLVDELVARLGVTIHFGGVGFLGRLQV
jgi:hypothetical protein